MVREKEAMKILTVLVATLALIAVPAHAQMGGKRHQSDDKKNDRRKRRSMTRPIRPRSREYPSPRKSTIPGVWRGPRSRPRIPQRDRNRS